MLKVKVGNTIRSLRQAQKKSIKEIAEKSQLTISYISQIERDLVSPSLITLDKIADALSVSITALFGNNPSNSPLVKKNERAAAVVDGNSKVTVETLVNCPEHKQMALYILTIPQSEAIRGGGDGRKFAFSHQGEEALMVMEGCLEFFVGDDRFDLEEGDCLYFDSTMPHYGRLLSRACKLLMAVVPGNSSDFYVSQSKSVNKIIFSPDKKAE